MRSKHFLALAAVGFGFGATALAGTGCGGGTSTNVGGGGSTTTVTTTTTTTKTTITTSSGTNVGGAGCGTAFESATELAFDAGEYTVCTLNDVTKDAQFFSFTGTKGDIVFVQTSAKVGNDPFDPAYVDTVATLYDDTKTQIARNDDPTPRATNDAQIVTVLPKDGTYYVKVQDCNAAFPSGCGDASVIATTDYGVAVFKIDSTSADFVFDKEPDDDIASALKVNYAKASTGGYYLARIAGTYASGTDVDVYSLNIPTDYATIDADQRALANFYVLPSGTDGDGSTADIGPVWLVDKDDPTHKVAQVDFSKGDAGAEISVPATFGHDYYLFVTRPAGATAGANDFYFVWNGGGGSNPIEKGDTATTDNDTFAKVEALTDNGASGSVLGRFFIDGDIGKAGDVDYYSLTVPAGTKTISAACGAQRSGSGLRGLKASLFKDDGVTPLAASGSTGAETELKDLSLSSVAVPAAVTKVIVKIEAASQDATVTSTFYRCGFYAE